MTPHLKGHVRAYVERALPPAMLHLYDKHLVCCTLCRAAADQERRIVAALRADTGVPVSLRSSLLGLASESPADDSRGASMPGVPLPPVGFRMPSPPAHVPVPTVRPTAPALHRSPMRAAVVASIAAGASVAAAWGLAVSPATGVRVPSVRGPVANFGANPAGVASFGGSILPSSLVSPAAPDLNRSGGRSSFGLPYWSASTRPATPARSASSNASSKAASGIGSGIGSGVGSRVGSGFVSGFVDSVRITTIRSAELRP